MVLAVCSVMVFFFFKQKTAYEMRISDWSSDVCSSDLRPGDAGDRLDRPARGGLAGDAVPGGRRLRRHPVPRPLRRVAAAFGEGDGLWLPDPDPGGGRGGVARPRLGGGTGAAGHGGDGGGAGLAGGAAGPMTEGDGQSVVSGKRVSVRVDRGGSRNIK